MVIGRTFHPQLRRARHRRLRDFDPHRAALLSAPLLIGDHSSFAAQIERELDVAGGRVHEGHVR
ncbi:hypothetical protein CQ044_02870 [Microbacterium sp. MYb64]|nr:hypothetical protein CQ044_02870 [Microbacterium sp. MYb64]